MNRLIPRHATRRPARPVERQATVCVVDPNTADYRAWHELATAGRVRLTLLTKPEEALKFSRANTVDLWVINTELPGLSGFELCDLLRSRSLGRTSICLVTDEYSPAAERAGWAARATLFLCKGDHANWLVDWLHSRSRPSPHSVPAAIRREPALRLPLSLPSPDLPQTWRA